jgi:hypothetical protein
MSEERTQVRPAAAEVTLVYIAGAHRSGATPLGAVLAGSPDVFYAGELYRFPHPIFEAPNPQRLCSCGTPVDACPFWMQVRARLDAEPGMLQSLRAGQLRYERWRSLLSTLWRRARRDPKLLEHVARMGRFVRVLAETSGSRVVVESSYNPLRGLLYRDPASGLNTRFLHLVRDGRNFLSSELHARDPPESNWRWVRSTPVILGRWVAYHSLTLALLARRADYLRVRFETFLATPGPALRQISRLSRVDPSAVIAEVEAGRSIRMRHIAAANRMRLEGEVRLHRELGEMPPPGPFLDLAFWVIGGWLALSLGYRPRRSPAHRALSTKTPVGP